MYYWCEGNKLWCATKHDQHTSDLLKTSGSVTSKEATQVTSNDNANAVSFAAQIQSIMRE